MGFVFNAETGKYEWQQSSFTPANPELERQAADDYELRRKEASQPIVDRAMQQPAITARDEQSMAQIGADISAAERKVAPPPKIPGVVTELDVTGSKRPIVSEAEGMQRPISAQEVIAKTEARQPTPEQQQAQLIQLQNQIIAKEQVKYEEQKKQIEARIAPSGVQSGDMRKMYIASANPAATPYVLEANKNTFDAANGLTNREVTPDELRTSLESLPKEDLSSFSGKSKVHVTGFSQQATASDYRFKVAVENDFKNGKAKADVALAALGRTPTLAEWNKIVNDSYSIVTRATARLDMPQDMLEKMSIDEANKIPYAASLVRDKGITPIEAEARANEKDATTTPEYKAWVQKQEPGSFYKDEKGRPKMREWTEGQYKAEAAKQALETHKQRLIAGYKLDPKDKTVKELYNSNGGTDVINFAEKDATFDPAKQWKGNVKANIVTNTSTTALDTVSKAAMENIKTQGMGESIDSAIRAGVKSGALKGLDKADAYTSFATKVLGKMREMNEAKNEEVRNNVRENVAASVGSLYSLISETDEDGNVRENPTTFHGFVPAEALGMVSKYGVNYGNVNEKAREILESTLGLTPDSIEGMTLKRQLALGDVNKMSPEVAAAYNFVKGYLENGLAQWSGREAVHQIEEQKREAWKESRRQANATSGLITDFIKDINGNDKEITFRNATELQAWKGMDTEVRARVAEQKEVDAKDFAVKQVAVKKDIERLKQGQGRIDVLVKETSPYGMPIQSYKPQFGKAAYEEDWDRMYDYLVQEYSGHPELWNQAENQWNESHDKWMMDIAKSNKWVKGTGFMGLGRKEDISVETVYNAMKEMSKLEGVTTESRITDALDKLKKDFPEIEQFMLRKGGATKDTALTKTPVEEANTPAVGTEKSGYKFKGGNPADKNNWEKI